MCDSAKLYGVGTNQLPYVHVGQKIYVPPPQPDVEPDTLAMSSEERNFSQWLLYGVGMFWLGVLAYWAFERAMR